MTRSSDEAATAASTPPVVGLVGGIGSGKTHVAQALRARGAVVVDADAICHDALERPSVRSQILERFGSVVDSHGRIHRPALRAVFADDDALRDLEAILHPIVRREALAAIRRATTDEAPLVVIDAPLLLESGMDALCDQIVYIDAPDEVRRSRVAHRGWDDGELARREAHQLPLDEKRRRADRVVPSGGTADGEDPEIDALWRFLTRPRR